MTIGLDIGEHATVVARDGVDPTTERTNFVELPAEEMVLDMLASGDVEYFERGGTVYAVGDAATDFAGMFDAPVESLLRDGVLTGQRDVDGVLVELLIEQVLGPADDDEQVVYATPADPVDADVDTLFYRRTIEDRLVALGYDPTSITRGVATGFAGAGRDAPSEIAIVLGTGTSEVCLLDDGQPVLQFGLGRGGSWIDRQVAGATDREPGAVADEREGVGLTTDEGVLGLYYENYLSYVVEAVTEHVTEEFGGAAVPVVVAGPAARPEGVGEVVSELLSEAGLPFDIGEVRVLDDPVTAVARGARLASEAEHSSTVTAAAESVDSHGETALRTRSDESSSRAGEDPANAPPVLSELVATVDELDERIEETDPGSMSSELDRIATDIEGIQERLDDGFDVELQRTVTETEDALSELRVVVDDIHSRVEKLETVAGDPDGAVLNRLDDVEDGIEERTVSIDRIEDLETRVDDLESRVTTVIDRTDESLGRLDDAENGIERARGRIADVESRIEHVEQDVSGTDDRVASLEASTGTVDGLSESLDDADDRLCSLEAALADVDERIERVDEVDAEIDDIGSRLDEDVGALRSDLDDVRSEVRSIADEDELRRLAADIVRERVLAPVAGGAGVFGLLAAGGAAVADALVLAGVCAMLSVVCLAVFVGIR